VSKAPITTDYSITSLWVAAIVTIGLNILWEGHWAWWVVGFIYLVTAMIMKVNLVRNNNQESR
jgi:hypothetical protein